MNAKIYELIDSYKDSLANMLVRWVQIPSVKGPADEGAPFGTEVRRMLDMAMVDAETMGFITHVYDGYACDIDLGEGADPIAVLGHLDVVPAGDGWTVEPFSATRDGDNIIGRGTTDDKGPVLAALFAMRAIKESGTKLRRPIKLILGCDEESGWEDMDYYAEHAKLPETGFSPDASFPMINTEKAIMQFRVTADAPTSGLVVKEMMNGERMNVIPGLATAVVAGDQAIIDKVNAYAQKTGLPYSAEVVADGVRITAEGIPGHSAYPEGRRNAIGMLLLLLKELGAEGVYKTLADCVGMDHSGKNLGISYQDDVSGALTCNMGILHLKNGKVTTTLDCRIPVTADLDKMEATVCSTLAGMTVRTVEKKVAHHVPADTELVQELLAAYHEETGLPAEPQYTGGGTYAKVLKQGVAFGSAFPDDEDLAHQANEFININSLIKATKVYANALVRLCAE